MEDLDKKIKKLSLRQGAIKILLNSVYGAFGNKWFYFFNVDLAQSITLQGQDLIKFSIRAINHYFKERWHEDTELHEILGIDTSKVSKVDVDSAIYTDTDSVYVQFYSALKSVEGLELTRDEYLKMCVLIDEHRLSGYFNEAFEKWSALHNTKNRQHFKIESISENGFWIMKKNYALRMSYEPNPKKELYDPVDRELKIVGLEPIKASYPEWARNHQKAFIELLLEKGRGIQLEEELIPLIKEVREEFNSLEIPDMAQNFLVRKYDDYVVDESKCLLGKGATSYAKSVMHHNHLININQLEGKYPKLRQGKKIKHLHCEPNELGIDVFAYNPGQFPEEIAPVIDIDRQFFILIVEPINRILGAFGLNKIDIQLKRAVEFKTTKSKKPLTEEQLYPLHVINTETLEHEEVPEKLWKLINDDENIPDEIFDEYLQTITKYGLNTLVIINKNLKPYKKRITKKFGLEIDV